MIKIWFWFDETGCGERGAYRHRVRTDSTAALCCRFSGIIAGRNKRGLHACANSACPKAPAACGADVGEGQRMPCNPGAGFQNCCVMDGIRREVPQAKGHAHRPERRASGWDPGRETLHNDFFRSPIHGTLNFFGPHGAGTGDFPIEVSMGCAEGGDPTPIWENVMAHSLWVCTIPPI